MLNEIFLWLVAASLRASLLALAVFAFQFALSRRLPAGWRYALWLPVVLVFVVPVLPESRWSVENYSALLMKSVPPPVTASWRENAAELLTTAWSVPSILCRCPLVPAGWLLGTIAVVSAAWIGYRRTMRRILDEAVPTDALLACEIAAAARQIHLRALPRVIVSTAVESPAVAGCWRPMLLLPASFPAGLSAVEARLILLHELTHLRRHDLPLNWLLCVLQALHWFNPLLWFVFGRIRADREAACDAQVLSAHAEDWRAEYGHALLKLHGATAFSGLSLGFTSLLAPNGLRARLLAVVRHRRANPVWSAVGALLILGLILAGVTRAPSNEGPPLANRQAGTVKESMDACIALAATGLNAVLNSRAERTRTDSFSVDVIRSLYGAGSVMNRGHGWQYRPTIMQSPVHTLPDWWLAAASARIPPNANPHNERWSDHRRFGLHSPPSTASGNCS